jgi:hypothetical protein
MLPYFKERKVKDALTYRDNGFLLYFWKLCTSVIDACVVLCGKIQRWTCGCFRWFLCTLAMVVVWILEKGDTKGHYAILRQSKKRHFDNPKMVDNHNFFFVQSWWTLKLIYRNNVCWHDHIGFHSLLYIFVSFSSFCFCFIGSKSFSLFCKFALSSQVLGFKGLHYLNQGFF